MGAPDSEVGVCDFHLFDVVELACPWEWLLRVLIAMTVEAALIVSDLCKDGLTCHLVLGEAGEDDNPSAVLVVVV